MAIESTKINISLRETIISAVDRFLDECGDKPPNNLYELVQEQVEDPLLRYLMEKTGNNQCAVTRLLGLARGTVRKKLKRYGLIK